MPAQPVGERGHGQQHDRQQQIEAQRAPVQKNSIGGLVDHESRCGDSEEAGRSGPQPRAVPAERPSMMTAEGHAQRHQPAGHVRHQRVPGNMSDQQDDRQPMHRSGRAAHDDEPGDAAGLTASQAERRICIAVDDFGLHAGICAAALRLASMGRVHAIGCMVGGASWRAWQSLLGRVESRRVDVGLHLDLTERPLTIVATPLKRIIIGSLTGTADRRSIRHEIDAQLDAFEQSMGRAPAFVDGHQHVHQLPVVRDALLDALRDRYVDAPPWLRSTKSGAVKFGPRPLDAFKARGIQALGAAGLAASARRSGFAQNARLWGIYDFRGGADQYLARMQAWLEASRAGDLFMCHPSMADDAADAIATARRTEFAVLSGPSFGALLQRQGVVLEPMSRILLRFGASS